MNIYHSTQVRPYVYMGIHKVTGHIYIGYRSANLLPSNLDLYQYKTSSTVVRPNFDMYDWQIIAEFTLAQDAYDFEQQLIYENWDNPLLENKMCHYGKNRFKQVSGWHHSESAKLSIGQKSKARINENPFTPEHVANRNAAVSKSNSERIVTSESNAKRSKTLKGRIFTEEHKRRISESKLAKSKGISAI